MSKIIEELPTYGQLERELSQIIHKLYREELGHSPSKVTCKFFNNKLAIVVENSLTTIERTLLKENKLSVVRNLNFALSSIIKSKLKTLVEQKLGIETYNVLFDFSLSSHSGAIFILNQPPVVRPKKAITKIQKSQRKNENLSEANGNIARNESLNLAAVTLYLMSLKPDRDLQPDIYLWKMTRNWDKQT